MEAEFLKHRSSAVPSAPGLRCLPNSGWAGDLLPILTYPWGLSLDFSHLCCRRRDQDSILSLTGITYKLRGIRTGLTTLHLPLHVAEVRTKIARHILPRNLLAQRHLPYGPSCFHHCSHDSGLKSYGWDTESLPQGWEQWEQLSLRPPHPPRFSPLRSVTLKTSGFSVRVLCMWDWQALC